MTRHVQLLFRSDGSVREAVRRFWRGTCGAVSAGFLLLLPGLVLIAGVAIDFTTLNAQRDFVQAQADLAAMSAIRNLSAREVVTQSASDTLMSGVFFEMETPVRADVRLGRLDTQRRFLANHDQAVMTNVSAVQVGAAAPMAMPVLGRFLPDPPPLIKRQAVSVAEPLVAFSLSNCLLSLRLLNDWVRPILGAHADVLCSGHGIRVHTFEVLDRLAVRADLLSPGRTYGEVLDAQVRMNAVMESALAGTGLLPLPGALSGELLRLSDFIHLSDDLRGIAVGSPVPPLTLNLADVVFGSVEVLGSRIVDLNVGVDLGAVGGARVGLQVSEPRIVVAGARPGDPEAVARTAQIRLRLEDVEVAGVVRIEIGVEVARAEARLSAQGEHCVLNPKLRAAVFDEMEAELLAVSADVRLPGLALGRLVHRLHRDLLSTRRSEVVVFTHEEVAAQTVKTMEADRPALLRRLDSALNGLLGRRGLPHQVIDLDPVQQTLAELLDLGIAEAQLSVQEVSCVRRLAG